MQSEITHPGGEPGPATYYAQRVVWFVAAALVAQVVAAIIAVWRNPTEAERVREVDVARLGGRSRGEVRVP
jgi:hypothetical protein